MPNWLQACRLCMLTEAKSANFTDRIDGFDINIGQMLEACTSIDVESDEDLPNLVCKTCLEELVTLFQSCAKLREKYDTVTRLLRDDLKQLVVVDEINFPVESFVEEVYTDKHEELAENVYEDMQNDDQDMYVNYNDIIEEIHEEETKETDFNYVEMNNEEYQSVEKKMIFVNTIENVAVQDALPLNMDENSKSAETASNENQTLQCTECGACFKFIENLNRHILANHPSNTITCGECSYICSTQAIYDVHMMAHQEHKVDDAERDFHKDQVNKARKKPHACEYCGKTFVSISALTLHIRIHTNDRPFQCSFCTKKFRTQGALDMHQRRHTGVRPYKCQECGKQFGDVSNLKVHMRQHTGEKPHECLVCNKRFSRVFLLQLHSRTHSGVKPYQCTLCGRTFSQLSDTVAHTRIHTGERPYKCDLCPKAFIKSSALTSHRRRRHP